MTNLMMDNVSKTGENTIIKKEWLNALQEEILQEFEGISLDACVIPFMNQLSQHSLVNKLKNVSIEMIETSSLLEMEQFLIETSLTSTTDEQLSISIEKGFVAQSEGEKIPFVKKDIELCDSPKGLVRKETMIGTPDVGIAPRYIIAAKHWEMKSGIGEFTEELTVMFYRPN